MTPELSKQLADLAQRLGTTASELWPILVAKARLEAIISLSFDAVVLIGLPFIIRHLIKSMEGPSADSFYDEVIAPMLMVVVPILWLAVFVDALVSLPTAIYPQAEAIKMILGH